MFLEEIYLSGYYWIQGLISTSFVRLKEQDELFNNQKKEYEREITHLRLLVKEKEELLQTVFSDKR